MYEGENGWRVFRQKDMLMSEEREEGQFSVLKGSGPDLWGQRTRATPSQECSISQVTH